MKPIKLLSMIIAVFILALPAYSAAAKSNTEIVVHGTFNFVDVEGGCWQFQGDDGVNYEVLNHEPAWYDGLTGTMYADVRDDIITICQVGINVEIYEFISDNPGPECTSNVEFEEVFYKQNSGMGQLDLVIETEEEWCEFWNSVNTSSFPIPACDTSLIDFSKEAAIVSSLGFGSNSCYGINISCIQKEVSSSRRKLKDITVFVNDIYPGLYCACLDVIVSPVHVVKVDNSVRDVDFVHTPTELVCGY